ncbi:hypothetical protein PAAG_08541 [Paracoccidioides lutzii Pb01]|uniref:Uncharacterized protein n=1 Tax=Paracoccidioides lutzii (strain ATCC MYA-826 / Pb01) TaxID=502779 RepID=C1HCQ0_PARBA|nr:hypothetical protein PAAG_08541 [Paracoccidioides lutzii Pb01]EEH38814.2 hypothetical protein PAAG_08541 [Paracoccidioides lutzii Pb01]
MGGARVHSTFKRTSTERRAFLQEFLEREGDAYFKPDEEGECNRSVLRQGHHERGKTDRPIDYNRTFWWSRIKANLKTLYGETT